MRGRRHFGSAASSSVSHRTKHLVIGGGVVGLACAHRLNISGRATSAFRRGNFFPQLRSYSCWNVSSPASVMVNRRIRLIDRPSYYPPDSLKTELCIRGKQLLYKFAEKHGIGYKRCGKWLIAQNDQEVEYLEKMRIKCAALGVPLQWLPRAEIARDEPLLCARDVLSSPTTGIIDSHSLMAALEAGVQANEGIVAYGTEVRNITRSPSKHAYLVETGPDPFKFEADIIVNAAGLSATKIARMLMQRDLPDSYETYYCKGHYFGYSGGPLVKRLVYPVPEKNLAGLGVHATVDLAGQMRFGPDTLYVDSPNDYRVGSGMQLDQVCAAVRTYIPSVERDKFYADYAGIRPKLSRKGEAARDFLIKHEADRGYPGFVNLVGIESPGLTSSLAIAERVSALLDNEPAAVTQRSPRARMERARVLASHLVAEDAKKLEEMVAVETAGETSAAAKNTITVVDNRTGKKYEIDIRNGAVAAPAFAKIVIDGEPLRLYDPAFVNTAPVSSRITFIDGEKGILRYRGYPIEQLAEKSSFLEVSYLIMHGELPQKSQLDMWSRKIMTHTYIHENVVDLMKTFRYDAHPMGMLISTIAALSTFYPESNPALRGNDIFKNPRIRNKQIFRIIGKLPTIAAAAYRHRIGRPYNQPNSNLGYTENFLYMMDSLNDRDYKPHPVLVRALDIMFILHADHEMNCSTAAMRHISSSLADPYSAMAGAAAALFGPLHGGATEAVLHMLEGIGSKENVHQFIADVKSKKRLLMGFGHRVYHNYDPRAKIIRRTAYEVFEVMGKEPLIEVAVELEKQALSDEYFISRKLYPNVDFYSGLIYKAMGFPTDMFPVLFCIPRAVGWLAHWLEGLDDPENKIARPRQIYLGADKRDYIPMDTRPLPAGPPPAAKFATYSATISSTEVNKRRIVSDK